MALSEISLAASTLALFANLTASSFATLAATISASFLMSSGVLGVPSFSFSDFFSATWLSC